MGYRSVLGIRRDLIVRGMCRHGQGCEQYAERDSEEEGLSKASIYMDKDTHLEQLQPGVTKPSGGFLCSGLLKYTAVRVRKRDGY